MKAHHDNDKGASPLEEGQPVQAERKSLFWNVETSKGACPLAKADANQKGSADSSLFDLNRVSARF